MLDAMKATSESISISNMKKLIKAADKLANASFDGVSAYHFVT